MHADRIHGKARELNIDDVLIARQHQALRGVTRALPTDIDLLFDDLSLFIGLYRPEMEMQARLGHFSLWFTKAKFHGEFIRLNSIDRLKKPETQHRCADEEKYAAIAAALAATATWKNFFQTVLALTENVFKIRRCVWSATARSLRSLPPWATVAAIIIVIAVIIIAAATPWAAAAILITPGHPHLSSGRRESKRHLPSSTNVTVL